MDGHFRPGPGLGYDTRSENGRAYDALGRRGG